MPSNELRPGVQSILSDGNLTIPQATTAGNSSILIIGFANNGPVNNPMAIGDATAAFAASERNAVLQNTLFGYIDDPASGKARLGAKFFEALRANVSGTPDIRVMRLGAPTDAAVDGQTRGDGRAYGFLTAGGANAVRIMGRWASKLYHRVHAKVDGSFLTLTYGALQSRYDLRTFPTHSDLVNAINLDPVATQFAIAEAVTTADTALTTAERKGTAGDLVVGTQIIDIKTAQVVQQILNTAADEDNYFRVLGATSPGDFREAQALLGEALYDVYVSDLGTQTTTFTPSSDAGSSTFTSGDALFIPRFTRVQLTQTVGAAGYEVNNPFPGVTAALSIEANIAGGGGLAQAARADKVLTTLEDDIEGRFRSTFLGAIKVSKIEQISDDDTAWTVENADGGATETVTEIHLVDAGKAVTLRRDDTGTEFSALRVTIPRSEPIPGGFYFGIHTGDLNTSGALDIFVWDPDEGTNGKWIELGDTDSDDAVDDAAYLTDGTVSAPDTMQTSGFVAIKQYARLARIRRNTGATGDLKFLFNIVDGASATTSGLKLFSIIPLHPEAFFQPLNATTDGFNDISYTVSSDLVSDQRIPLTASSTVPSDADLINLAAYEGIVYRGSTDGSANDIGSTHVPPVITFRVATAAEEISATATDFVVQCLSTQETQATCKIADLNKIKYSATLNTDGSLQIANLIRDFGFDAITSRFGAKLLLNGWTDDVWGNGFLAVDLDDPSGIVKANGVIEADDEGYVANRWKFTYTQEVGAGATLAIQEGFLGSSGGLNGKSGRDFSNMSIDEKQMALSAALANIEGYPVDIVVLSGMYLDDVVERDQGVYNAGFHHTLHGWLQRSIADRHEAMGVISVKPFDLGQINGSKVGQYADRLTNLNGAANSAANVMEAFQAVSGCMSVVVGEPLFNTGMGGSYNSTSEASYAGLLASLRVADSTTNKRIRGASRMRFGFTKAQQDALMRHRFAVVDSAGFGGPPAVLDGVTAANNSSELDRSDYTRIATVRTIFEMLQAVRATAAPYVGQPNHPTVTQSLKFGVQKVVDDYIAAGYIVAGKSTVSADLRDQVNGNVRITLDIKPAIEIRRIIVTTSLRPTLD
jgi:hypothetical protein